MATRTIERVPPVDALSLCGGMAVCASEAAISGPAPETCDRARDGNTRINPKITAADNTYVRSIADPAQRAEIVTALRRAGLK